MCSSVGLMTNISHDAKNYVRSSKKYAFLAFSNLLVLMNNNKLIKLSWKRQQREV